MTEMTAQERFELLDAGRALGDLSPEEKKEWEELSRAHAAGGNEDELSFDDLVSALETSMSPAAEVPAELTGKLREGAQSFEQTGDDRKIVAGPWKRILSHPVLGWAVAACFAVLLLVQNASRPEGAAGVVAQVDADAQAVQMQFAGLGRFDTLRGMVRWSDSRQQGLMRLTGLAANDPAKSQYQLWIVDNERGGQYPVDGGVFDIPATANGEVLILIDSKLEVNGPSVFVITLEQPGGVVVSGQEQVVAIARPKEA